ncbi:hypothetical protein NQ318_007566 [Aromia moschata]|uniref:PiggyBac transposable element-derived protein domain-containing protein n=1 Tax=Aromia moschata TaxID=1265417 RepID=A0AAV8YCW6_9CUCU|nr:hypothetical protein NQ318_007566 [Aromia moschata]
MSFLKFPRIRMYWDTDFKMTIFTESMSRNRFFQLRTTIHVVNNLDKPDNCFDKLYKVRPLYDSTFYRNSVTVNYSTETIDEF